MYLKSLELHGFKSFPDRTLLKFNNGATIIVGPNGSGKSNITDAMRWVLGELSSKNIRGSKMEDVIFAGADDKKPMSFAEVSVTFDDSTEPRVLTAQYDEVTVTRRFYRSGDSEYFINRKKVRLRDIYELFMNTGVGREGYSIIGQGKIAEIISKKSEERRGVFEESAGISKYRYKKTESEKKLAETLVNMERVEDIEGELAARIGPLERDSARARQYLELYGEKKKVDVSLWLYDSDKLKVSLDKAEDDTKLSAHELDMVNDSIKNTTAKIERLYDESHSNKEALQKNHEELTAATKLLTDTEAEILVLAKEREHSESKLSAEREICTTAQKSIQRENEKSASLREQLNKAEKEHALVNEEYDALTLESAKLEAKIEEYTGALEKSLARQQSGENELTDLRVRLNVLENSIANQKKRSQAVESEIESYMAEISELDKKAAAAETQITDYQKALEKLDAEIGKNSFFANEIKKKFSALDAEARSKQSQLDSLDSRITAMERMREHFDGYNNSIKHVMNEARAGRLSGIRGPVSYLIKVPSEYTVAIETALGSALQNIVTDDEEAAKRSIRSLMQNNAGRATFYPLSTIRPQMPGREFDGLDRAAGFVGFADSLVSFDAEYTNIVKSLLARTVVFDNLDNATSAAKSKSWRIRAVTLDGQQVNVGGSLTGGQTKRDSGILSRAAQIERLSAERNKTAEEFVKIKNELDEQNEKLRLADRSNAEIEERRKLINSLIGVEQKNFSETDGKRSTLKTLVENLHRDNASLEESNSSSSAELDKLRGRISEKSEEISKIREERENTAALRGECELFSDELGEKLNERKIRLAELSRDKEAVTTMLAEASARIDGMKDELSGHSSTILTLVNRIEEVRLESEEKSRLTVEYKKNIDSLATAAKELDESGNELELQLTRLRQTEKEQNATKDLCYAAHTKNEARLASLKNDVEKLTSRLWDEYELTYATAFAFAEESDCHKIEDGERSSYLASQNELKQRIKALGHVNVEAINEYTEVKTRYDFIKKQLDDLRASRESLQKIIDGIETDMKEIFLEAFGRINTYFGEVFRELFGGGHAEVRLTDPEDVLNSGIEINAAPPGKTIKNLNLLSGGEQAFIAIALLFALIKVNPSPFCIFDEIEAALDEVNVTRVGRYIKKISREMQIIMITHRPGTMEIADTLYGVTMEQSGVSKVSTLDLPAASDN